jgi:hypothetical protein
LKDDESNSNPVPDGSQKGSPLQIERDLQQEHLNGIGKDEEHDAAEVPEFEEPKQEERKPTRGRGGRGGRGGGRGRGRRPGTPLKAPGRRGGARGTPRMIPVDRDDGTMLSIPLPAYEDSGSAQISVVGTPTEELQAFHAPKPKPRRVGSSKAISKLQQNAIDDRDMTAVDDVVGNDLVNPSSLGQQEGLPINGVANGTDQQPPPHQEVADFEIPTKID